jgi:predicted nucleic-acid-binding protein
MIGIDTNILTRFVVEDDPVQTAKAIQLLQTLSQEQPGFVSIVALAEWVWVLRRHYGMPKTDVVRCVLELMNSPEIVLEDDDAVGQALTMFSGKNVDFPDCLIERIGLIQGCTHTFTFDKKSSRLPGMVLL